jgi:hypothetical protein
VLIILIQQQPWSIIQRKLGMKPGLPNLTQQQVHDLLESTGPYIFPFSISVFCPDEMQAGFNPDLVCSGVLATSFGYFGILTAGHCAELIFKVENVALPVSDQVHHFYTKTATMEHVPIEEIQSHGPDLSFIIFREQKVIDEILRSGHRFYDLDNQDMSLLAFPLVTTHWCICGSAFESLDPSTFVHDGEPHKLYLSSLNAMRGKLLLIENRGNYDYISLELLGPKAGYPSDYTGCSGGGIWYHKFNSSDGVNYTVHPILAGITTWQYKQKDDKFQSRKIEGHYARSIYTRVRLALRQKREKEPITGAG